MEQTQHEQRESAIFTYGNASDAGTIDHAGLVHLEQEIAARILSIEDVARYILKRENDLHATFEAEQNDEITELEAKVQELEEDLDDKEREIESAREDGWDRGYEAACEEYHTGDFAYFTGEFDKYVNQQVGDFLDACELTDTQKDNLTSLLGDIRTEYHDIARSYGLES